MRSVMRGIEKPNAAKGKEESRRGTTVDSDTEERLRETERDTERERERERRCIHRGGGVQGKVAALESSSARQGRTTARGVELVVHSRSAASHKR
jgi:hypothetical protein